ncbi:MAG TPA: hypothetical protein VGA56_02980 [Opitutaceae bacterium]
MNSVDAAGNRLATPDTATVLVCCVKYRSTGPGARPETRVPWARSLSEAEAAAFTVENVLRGADGWHPNAP